MPAAMKGAISFGLLHMPISLHTAKKLRSLLRSSRSVSST